MKKQLIFLLALTFLITSNTKLKADIKERLVETELMVLNDSTTYTYNLRRLGSDRVFTVSFDLTKEVDIPKPSWGLGKL